VVLKRNASRSRNSRLIMNEITKPGVLLKCRAFSANIYITSNPYLLSPSYDDIIDIVADGEVVLGISYIANDVFMILSSRGIVGFSYLYNFKELDA